MGSIQKIVRLNQSGRVDRPKDGYRKLREDYGLNMIAAAAALETSVQNIELWDAQGNGPGEDFIRMRFEIYVRDNVGNIPSNSLIGTFPLSLAREVLEISVDDIAAKYGYSASTWYKFEKNQRLLDRNILREIEQLVRIKFADACLASDSSL